MSQYGCSVDGISLSERLNRGLANMTREDSSSARAMIGSSRGVGCVIEHSAGDDPSRAAYLAHLMRERKRKPLTGAIELMKRPGGGTRMEVR